MSPPPPPHDVLQVIHISSVEAALAKLNIGIPTEDFIKAIRDEEKVRDVAEERQLIAFLSEFETVAPPGSPPTPVAPETTKPTNVDPDTKERRRHLVELTKQKFPDGKVLAPLSLVLNAAVNGSGHSSI